MNFLGDVWNGICWMLEDTDWLSAMCWAALGGLLTLVLVAVFKNQLFEVCDKEEDPEEELVDRCECCGEVIPKGERVCPACVDLANWVLSVKPVNADVGEKEEQK